MNAQVVEIAHRLAAKEDIKELTDVRGTGFIRKELPEDWSEIDSTHIDELGKVEKTKNPYDEMTPDYSDVEGSASDSGAADTVVVFQPKLKKKRIDKLDRTTSLYSLTFV